MIKQNSDGKVKISLIVISEFGIALPQLRHYTAQITYSRESRIRIGLPSLVKSNQPFLTDGGTNKQTPWAAH